MNNIALGHCRVSKGGKEEIENSLKSQQSEIAKLAKRLDIQEEQIDWFVEEEARSSFSDRADWAAFDNKVDEVCKNTNIAYFLAFSQERFCRNSRRSKMYKDKLRAHGVEIRFVTGDVENPDSTEGFIMEHTNEMVAELYSRKVSSDTIRGCRENARTRDIETGFTYKNGGAAPFWLMRKEITIGKGKYGEEIKKIIWVENTYAHTATINNKPVTKTMWEWTKYYFLELRLNQGLSIKAARDVFNELEIPAPRGNMWVHTCLYAAENNPALYGLGIYNRRQFARNGGGRIKDKSEWVQEENAHPALLTKEQFEQLAELRSSKTRKYGKSSTNVINNKLLVNNPERFYCTSCGSKIISSGNHYTCGKYNTKGKHGCGSSAFNVSAAWLEEKIINDIKASFNSKILRKTYDDFITELKNHTAPDKDKAEMLEKNISKMGKDIDATVKSLTTVAATGNQIATKAIANELEKMTRQKETWEQELSEYNKPTLVKLPSFKEFEKQSQLTKALLSPENIYQKRKIVWMFVKSITFDPQGKAVTVEYYKNPLNTLLENNTKSANASPKIKEAPYGTSNKLVAGTGFEPMTFGL